MDEDGTTLGEYTKQLANLGFNVLDANGKLRDMGDVVEEIGNKWETLTKEQQVSLAQTMAGTRQYSNLISLFDSWDMYEDALNTSKTAAGTLQKQQDTYMESTKAHLEQMTAAFESLYSSLLDTDTINTFTDGITAAVKAINTLVDGLGGGLGVLTKFGSVATTIFSKQIVNELLKFKNNFSSSVSKPIQDFTKQLQEGENIKHDPVIQNASGRMARVFGGEYSITDKDKKGDTVVTRGIGRDLTGLLSEEELKGYKTLIADMASLEDKLLNLEERFNEAKKAEEGFLKVGAVQNIEEIKIDDESPKIQFQKNIELAKKYHQELAEDIEMIYQDVLDSDSFEEYVESRNDDFQNLIKRTQEAFAAGLVTDKKNELVETAYKEYAKALKNYLDNASEENLAALKHASNILATNLESAAHDVEGKVKAMETTGANLSEGVYRTLNYRFQAYRDDLDKTIKNLTDEANYADLLTVASSLGTVTNSILTLSNIGEIWSDETISNTEKFSKSVTTLGTNLPFLIQGLLSLKKALPGAVDKGKELLASLGKFLANPYVVAFAAIAAAIGLIAYQAYRAATAGDRLKAKIAEIREEADKLNESYNELKSTHDSFKDSISSYDEAVDGLKELHEKTEAYTQQIAEANEQALALIEANKELAKFAHRDKETGLITFDEGAFDEILKEQEDALANLQVSKYNKLIEANTLEAESAFDDLQKKAKYTTVKTESGTTNGVPQTKVYYNKGNASGGWDNSNNQKEIKVQVKEDVLNKVIEKAKEDIDLFNADTLLDKDLNLTAQEIEALTPIVEEILEVAKLQLDNEDENDFYDEELIRGFAEKQTKFSDYDSDVQNYIVKRGKGYQDSDKYKETLKQQQQEVKGLTTEELKKQYASFYGLKYDESTKKIQDSEGKDLDNQPTTQEMQEAVAELKASNEILSQIYTEAETDANQVNNVGQKLESQFGIEGLAQDLLNFGENGTFSLENIITGLISDEDKEALKEAVAGFTEGMDESTFNLEAFNEAIDNFDTDNLKENLDKKIDSYDSSISSNKKTRKSLEEAESLEDVDETTLQNIEALKEKYEELNDVRLEGLQDYKNVLQYVIEKEEIEQQQLLKQKKDLESSEFGEKLEVELDLNDEEYQEKFEALQEELYDFLDADYELDIAIDSDIEDTVDHVVSRMDDLSDAASLIGDNYTVAADDLAAFAEMFPQIVNAAQEANGLLADGSLYLGETLRNQAIETAETEISTSRESALSQIQQQRSALQAKVVSLRAAAEAASAASQAIVDDDANKNQAIATAMEALAGLKQDENEATIDDSAEVTEAEVDNYEGVGTQYQRIAATTATNSQALARSMAANVAEYASSAITNYKAVAEAAAGNKNVSANSNFTATNSYGSGTGVTTDFVSKTSSILSNALGNISASDLSNLQDASGSTWAAVADKLNQQADAYEKAIANLTAQESELMAASNKLSSAGVPTSSGSGSGGSGGGSDSEKEAEQVDLLEDEYDRYHDINIEIEELERNISRLQKAQDKLLGKDLISNLNEQLAILEKQVDAYERKIQLARTELVENKVSLLAAGVTFDADGQISNYAEAFAANLKKVNDAISYYNSLSADAQETEKANLELAKEQFEDFKEQISKYDELLNTTIPDLEDSITDAIDQQIQINIDKFKMSIEIRLDMAEAERDWNDFKKKVIDGIKDDDILGSVKSQYADLISYWNTAQTGTGPVQSLTKQLEDTLDQLKQMDNGVDATAYGNNRAQAFEDLKTYLDELQNQLISIEELVEDIEDSYLDIIQETKDAFDEQLENYETISDIIEHNKNVISLLYGDDQYDAMDKYFAAQTENNNKQLDFLRKEADFWKEKMAAEEQGSEAWKEYKSNWEDAIGNLNSLVEDSIQNLIDKYTNLIDSIFDKLNNKLSGGLGLDYVNDEWDLINKNADEYLDTINASYALSQLQSKFQDALNNNDGLQAQKQINALMKEQLDDLSTRDKLTQYDVDRAEKLLDIELKKIALQDAQQNKSKMRLRRDSQGNYSYQFTSDEDKVREAQEDLAAAQNELYNFDKERYQNNLNEIYSTYEEFQEKLKELYADTTLADEEREAKKALLIEQYGELINAKTEQNAQIRLNLEQSAFTELAKMYDTNLEAFTSMTTEQKNAILEELIPYWNSGIQQMVDTFTGEGGFIPTCSESFKELEEATKDYSDELDDLANNAGYDFDAIQNGLSENLDLMDDLLVKNDELLDQYDREIQAVQQVIDQVKQLTNAYSTAKQEAIGASEAAYKYWQEEQARQAKEAAEEQAKLAAVNSSSSSGSSSSSTSSSSSSVSAASADSSKSVTLSNIKIGDKLKYLGGNYYYTSAGSGPTGNRGPGGTVEVFNINPNGKYKVAVTSNNSAYGWLNPDQLEKFDTGGYTGDWGSDGKFAMLHQKELVLNADDTENMLHAVGIIRNLTSAIGASALGEIAGMLSGINSYNLKDTSVSSGDVLEQQVHIEANFPNVTNSTEIEDALKNLTNVASQYVNRNSRIK